MIDFTLSKARAEMLFLQEAVLLDTQDAVPEHRIVELFGPDAGRYAVRNMKCGGYLVPGVDCNLRGTGEPGSPILAYFYHDGFLKIVSNHNYRLTVQAHQGSESGKEMDALWEARADKHDSTDMPTATKANRKRKSASSPTK
jgi:hypothetical protein